MNKIFIALCVFFAFIISANAGEMYSCIDSEGNAIVTSTPQDGMTKCVLKDAYDDPTPQQKAQREREKAYNRNREEAITREETVNNQGKSRVELEKTRLENKKKNYDKSRYSSDNDKYEQAVDKRIKQLESDPDQYFYDKEERDKEAARNSNDSNNRKPKTVFDTKSGQWISVH